MTRHEPDHEDQKGNAARAALPPADRRSDQPEFSDLEPDDSGPDALPLSDTTSIRHGAQAVMGKAVWSASQMGARSDAIAVYDRSRKEAAEREARELANLAIWNRQLTTINGVTMTNAEAQDARQRVTDNADAYADRAIAQGKMEEADREEFKRVIARKKELEDKRGRGTMTAAEGEEARQLDRSRIGKVVDAATVDAHQGRLHEVDAKAERATANVDLRRADASPPVSEAVFRDYAVAAASRPPPQEIAASIKATGLDL